MTTLEYNAQNASYPANVTILHGDDRETFVAVDAVSLLHGLWPFTHILPVSVSVELPDGKTFWFAPSTVDDLLEGTLWNVENGPNIHCPICHANEH